MAEGDEKNRSLQLAKIAEATERWKDMVEHLTKMVKVSTTDLTLEERNLLSVGFKNIIGQRRAALRQLDNLLSDDNSKYKEVAVVYRAKIKKEAEQICKDFMALYEEKLGD